MQALDTCTFEGCALFFVVSEQWKDHEQENHVQVELWKCPIGVCTQKSYTLKSYTKHIITAHKVTGKEIEAKTVEGHV